MRLFPGELLVRFRVEVDVNFGFRHDLSRFSESACILNNSWRELILNELN